MSHFLDLQSWARHAQFEFFRGYQMPFFNICANVDVTALVAWTKRARGSFFKSSLYLSTKAANEVEPFRYRMRDAAVIVHDCIHAGSTVLNDDETFSFCYFDYLQPYTEFAARAEEVLRTMRSEQPLDAQEARDDLLHYSVIPWISFTSFQHARKTGHEDSIPKIVFGKYAAAGETLRMPVSVEVHHALMDGIHVAQYFERLQSYLNAPEDFLNE